MNFTSDIPFKAVLMKAVNEKVTPRKVSLLTSESVTEGHPDKICDQISDAILDEYLRSDPSARVAVETMASKDRIIVSGEVTSKSKIDIEKVVRGVLIDIGYVGSEFGLDGENCEVQVYISSQSPDIKKGVDGEVMGAGDQGMMYGYACEETPEFMPLGITLAHRLCRTMARVRKDETVPHLGPDGKAQVTITYSEGVPIGVSTIVLAQQHTRDISVERLRKELREQVVDPICKGYLTDDSKIIINGAGDFILGGPAADTGVTGRKIMVDTYGGIGRHGGGAFSGKDPTKVDRTGAYMARFLAKNIVARGMAHRCEIQLSYCIGIPEPISVNVETFQNKNIDDGFVLDWIGKNFDLRPGEIIKKFDLLRPIYKKTSCYGHFGRKDVPWEGLIEELPLRYD